MVDIREAVRRANPDRDPEPEEEQSVPERVADRLKEKVFPGRQRAIELEEKRREIREAAGDV